MPTLYDIKPAFQARLRPVVRGLAAAGVTANQVTLAACLLSVAAGAAIALWPESRGVFWLLPLALFLRMALNAVDGMLAREHGQASKLGMFLNEICDVASDLALILPFAVVGPFPAWGVVAFAMTAMLTEFAGVLGIAAKRQLSDDLPPPLTPPRILRPWGEGVASPSESPSPLRGGVRGGGNSSPEGRRYDGPLGKSDRALALGVIAVALAVGAPLGAIAPYIFPLLALLSLATVANRVRAVL